MIEEECIDQETICTIESREPRSNTIIDIY